MDGVSEKSNVTGSKSSSTIEPSLANTDPSSQVPTPDVAEAKSVESTQECRKDRKWSRKAVLSRKDASGNLEDLSSTSSPSEDEESSNSTPSETVRRRQTRKSTGRRKGGAYHKSDKLKPKSRVQDEQSTSSENPSAESGTDSDPVADVQRSKQSKNEKKAISKAVSKAKTKVESAKGKTIGQESGLGDDRDQESSRIRRAFRRRSQKPETGLVEDFVPDATFNETPRSRSQWTSLGFRGVKLSQVIGRSKDPKGIKTLDAPKSDDTTTTAKSGSRMEFVRTDRLWEKYNWVTRATGHEGETAEFDEFAFNVQRELDYEGKLEGTSIHIKNKALRDALIKVLGNVKCVTLSGESPCVDPKILFNFLNEIECYRVDLKKRLKSEERKRTIKKLSTQIKTLKILIRYLHKDFGSAIKELEPLLEKGKITFSLLWALFKPNEVVYARTYDTETVPRAFRVDYAYRMKSLLKGNYYLVEGEYLDYDGKKFGRAAIEVSVETFNGPRSISRLPCYPIRYHPQGDQIRQQLIDRGKVFVQLPGIQFKYHHGMAFHKIVKLNVDGRVMVDPENFRRINPNYTTSALKAEDPDILPESEPEEESSDGDSSDEDDDACDQCSKGNKEAAKKRKKVVRHPNDKENVIVEVDPEPKGNEVMKLEVDDFDEEKFTDEDYLLASPVVLGFSFQHKQWVELDVAGLRDIEFSEGAFESLVLPDDQKEVVRALVESHIRKDGKNITDVIQGKGEGLVTVLHGPPGCGKTLTAEGIAELLKKPLYMVSVGELGTRGGDLERNFSQIIDIAHCWGAILLLDEADIFLEKRSPYDISRNALVSIFLRLLEYFHGIVFLTTNRVVTFDEAFQSRIHVGLRYGELGLKAKKEVWRLFLDRVKKLEGVEMKEIRESDLVKLSQYDLNGREIKNSVRTAQSLATIEKKPLSMDHLLKVLFVGNVFAKDLKGPGYEEALKFYM